MELFKLFGSVFLNDREARQGLEEIDKQAEGVSGKFGKMGSAMTTAGAVMTGAIGLVGGSLIKMASDAETANAKIQASLGLTEEEAKKLGDVGRNIYNGGFGESLEEVNQALITTKTNIQGLNDADLQSITQQAMSFAELFDEDVNASTATASVMMKNFGVDAQTAFDLMTVGMQKGGNFSQELLDTMREYSPQFATMGMSADQMLGILIKGAEQGAWNLDKVGDAVKEFNIRAKDGSKTTADGFKAIGMDAEKMGQAIAQGGEKGEQAFQATIAALAAMEDPVARNQAGVALFGTQWEDLETKVVAAMAEGVKGIEGFEGASAKASATMQDTFGNRLQSMWREAQSSLMPLANTLLDLAEKYLPPLISGIQKVVGVFTNLPDSVQVGILIFGGLMAVIAPLLVVFGTLASGIGALIPLFTAGGAAAGVFGAGMTLLTGPVGIVIAIIGALIAIGVLLYKNWDEVKAYAISAWGAITSTISQFAENAKAVLNAVMQFIAGLFNSYLETWKAIFMGAFQYIVTVIKTQFDIAKTIVSAIFETIKAIFTGDLDSIKGIWSGAWDKITNIIGGAKDAIFGIVDSITGKIKGMMDKISEGIRKAKELIGLGGDSGSSSGTSSSSSTPRYANGTDSAVGGLAVVGERGRELVKLPRGAQVLDNYDTEKALGNSYNQYLTINSPTPLSPYEIARKTKQASQQAALEWGFS